jgi:hypothetical protein
MICILRSDLGFPDKQYGVVINFQNWRFYSSQMVFIGLKLEEPPILLKGDVNLADAD